MRIGINSGLVIVGSIGDDLRMDYTAVGDTTNLASRIENMAEPGTCLVSNHTYRLARDFFEFRALGNIKLKGKEQPQKTYELIRTGKAESRIEASIAKGLSRFVGRKNSMGALINTYEKVQTGTGQVVGVVGDAGVGKSRLLLEFQDRLPEDDFTYLEGRCLHFGGTMAYLPILDILRSYFRIKEGDHESLINNNIKEKVLRLDENLQSVLPPIQELLSLNIEDQTYLKLDPAQKRERTFEAIRDLLVRESQNKTVILVIEDLHWIDKTSEEFLSYLIEWLANTHILLIVLYRPEYTHPWGSKSYYNRIGLDQLTTKSSTELIKAILPRGEPVPELSELILNRAAGNPLFMEEFTHTLLEKGAIQCKDNQCILIKKATEIEVPDTIQGIIAARIDRLEDDLKRIMQVASVIGRDFAFRILETITEMRQELKAYLLNLQGLEFIYEKTLFPELEYVFKHALTQEVAYNSLLQKRRKEIHEKIGRAIEDLWPDRIEEFYEMLAYHYSRSDNLEKAYQFLKLSANKAVKNYSNWEAFRFYKDSIYVLTTMPETDETIKEQIEIRLLMAGPMFHLGFPEDSLEILQTGERLSKELGEEKALALLLSIIGQYYAWKGEDLLQAIQYSEKSFMEADKINDIDLMAPIGTDLVFLYFWMGEYVKATDIASKVIELLEKSQRQTDPFGRPYNVYSILLALHATCSWRTGHLKEGEALYEKGLDFAIGINDLFSLGLLELNRGWEFNFQGEAKAAIEHFQNCFRYCEEGQIVSIVHVAWLGLGWAYWLKEDFATALTHVEKGLKMQIDKGVPQDMGLFFAIAGMVELDSGDLKKAKYRAEEGVKISQTNHQHGEGFAWILLGRTLGKSNPSLIDRAEKSLLKGIKIYEKLKIKAHYVLGYFFLVEMYVDTGRKDKALETLKTAELMFREMGMDYWLAKTRKIVRR